ncbi:tail length tape measure protein [Klebsiella phage VLCpiS11a]|uniref:tail length tape measure protein n=1 Tax=Klebsiella phage VLCpiS11a TaxID=2874884 RepID=UPI0022DCD8B9|nr:tail length tape measure protein [Klebsiella phage VLCpiS11a]UVX30697.1 tail length tape measure protein [Klebsiella phage VLCpiS11a]
MADTASLVARVKTEGADAGAKQLDQFASSADRADASVNRLTPDVKKSNDEMVKAAKGGMSAFRNGAQQVGFQVQDMVVQLQSGTSAFVAIGQQGSQLAGAFGPGGAVLGAVIALASAVGGVLYKAFTDTGASAKDLEKGASELSKSFQTAKDGTIEFSDALVQLSQNGDAAYGSMVKLIGLQAAQQIERATTAIREQGKELLGSSVAAQTNIATLDDMIARNMNVGDTLSNINVLADANSAKYGNLAAAVNELAATYGVGTKEISDMLVAQRQFNAEPSAENAQKVADATAAAAVAAKENKKELLDQATAAQQNANALATAQKQQDLVTESQKKMGAATNEATRQIRDQNDAIIAATKIQGMAERDRFAAQAKLDKEAFAKRQGVTKAQIAEFNKARDAEAAYELKKFDEREAKKTAAQEKAAATRAAAAAKREANAKATQDKNAQSFLDQIARTNSDEIKEIDAKEQQKLEKAKQYLEAGNITQKEYEDAKTAIVLEAGAARQKELDKRQQEAARKQGQHDQYIADIQALNATELELIDVQQKAKEDKAKEFYDRGIISEQEYQNALLQIAQQADEKRLDSYSKTLSDTTSSLKSALGEGNALYKAAAITETVINTYKAATAAYSALAPIPIIGPALGVAAAAAAVAAGAANVAKIRSAREQGGTLSAGQASTIAERGKPEVIMPASASRVRTAQQMRQIMGENGSKQNSSDSVVIVNQTTGRIDQASTERDDEGRLRVIIRETVSGDLQDSNSQISLSRRNTRNQPGF